MCIAASEDGASSSHILFARVQNASGLQNAVGWGRGFCTLRGTCLREVCRGNSDDDFGGPMALAHAICEGLWRPMALPHAICEGSWLPRARDFDFYCMGRVPTPVDPSPPHTQNRRRGPTAGFEGEAIYNASWPHYGGRLIFPGPIWKKQHPGFLREGEEEPLGFPNRADSNGASYSAASLRGRSPAGGRRRRGRPGRVSESAVYPRCPTTK